MILRVTAENQRASVGWLETHGGARVLEDLPQIPMALRNAQTDQNWRTESATRLKFLFDGLGASRVLGSINGLVSAEEGGPK